MLSEELPKQIALLVDNLRQTEGKDLSLTEISSVSEVLIRTMMAFFKSIDTTIYKECRALSDYIDQARLEIANMQPVDLESDRIPRAGLELDAIVQHTEEATNTIMEAAEEIMGLDPSDPDTFTATTQDAVMRIFEACSFQDITGQRISKVVQTLEHIEDRVLQLRDVMGITDTHMDKVEADAKKAAEESGDKALLRGPALDGEGMGQDDVDSLLNDGAAAPAPAPAPAATPAAAPAPPPPPPPPPKPEAVDPKKLDAMFEEDFDPLADMDVKDPETEPEPVPAAPPAAEPKAAAHDDDDGGLKAGEDVSQDDIDALFG